MRIQSKSSSESPVQMVLRGIVGRVDDIDDGGEGDCCDRFSCRGYDGDDDNGRERRLLLLREISFEGSKISYCSWRLRRWMPRAVSASAGWEIEVEVEVDIGVKCLVVVASAIRAM
jgi:hypothetical protein